MTTPLPLVMLPGLNNTRAVFDSVEAALDARIKVCTMDLPALETVEALADYVLAQVPERFFLCGFSFGGYVALAMLEKAPERIAGLALVGSLPGADTAAGQENRRKAIEIARSGGYQDYVQAAAAAAFHPDSLQDSEIMTQRSVMVSDYGPDRFIAHSWAAMARPDRRHVLDQYDGPLLMLAGDRDPLSPRERMETLVGSARTRIIAGAGHLLPLEQPIQMARILSNWILSQGTVKGMADQ